LLVVALVLSVCGLATGVEAPPAAAGSTSFTMTNFRFMVTDPGTGRVFVSGDDKVVVFNAAGSVVGTVTGLEGASGMAVEADRVIVAETGAGTISEIDASTLAVVETHPTGRVLWGTVVAIGNTLWFGVDKGFGFFSFATLDRTTDAVVDRGGNVRDGWFGEVPGHSDRLIAWNGDTLPYTIYNFDISGPTVADIGHVPHGTGSDAHDVAVAADGSRFWVAAGSPSDFDEIGYPSMIPTGARYPGGFQPTSVAYSPAAGGIVAGGTSDGSVFVAKVGTPLSTHAFELSSAPLPLGVELAPDASRVYAVTAGGSESSKQLETIELASTTTSVAPASVVSGVPTEVTLTGSGYGAVTAVTVGGVPAEFDVVSPTQLRVTMPIGVAVGSRTIAYSAPPFGGGSISITVTPNTGAHLAGTVTDDDGPLAGIEVTLSGGGLGVPATHVTDAVGHYSFTGVPWGDDYTVLFHDPAGESVDQTATHLALVPNLLTTLDRTMGVTYVPPPPSALVAETPLPSIARDVVVDPAHDVVYVSAGDQVVVFDLVGRQIGRIPSQYGAAQMVLAGDDLYVNEVTAGRISHIDTDTLAVVEEWPTLVPTDGALALAGGRLWFTTGDDQWVGLGSVDPTDGSHLEALAMSLHEPELGSVSGAPDVLLAWDRLSAAAVFKFSVAGAEPVMVAEKRAFADLPDAVGVAGADRVWLASGDEIALDDLEPTGAVYPTTGAAVAYTPTHGGVLAFGTKIAFAGEPTAIATLGRMPAERALAFAPDGRHVFVGTGTGTFAVWDLAPHVTAATPGVLRPEEGGLVTLTGTGLATVSEARVDGTVVPADAVGDSVVLNLPAAVVPDEPTTIQVLLSSPFGTTDAAIHLGVDHVPPWPLATAPSAVEAEAGRGTVVLSWAAPLSDGAGTVTSYEISIEGESTMISVPATQHELTLFGMPWVVPLTYRVRARTAVGASVWASAAPVFVGVPPYLFSDVPPRHPFYWEIWWAVENDVTSGFPGGTFRPLESVSRQAVVSWLWRSSGSPDPTAPPPFSDVGPTHPFRDAIAWAAAEGIVGGFADGTFRGNEPVNRQAVVAFLWRMAGSPAGPFPDPHFKDVPVGHPFRTAILWASATGVTHGYADGTFRPGATVSRQAAMAFIARPHFPQRVPITP
jgi:hypothetical protein